MTKGWKDELRELRTVSAPESMGRRVAAGPRGAGMPPRRPRGSRLAAAVVAIVVFVAAGAFAFRALGGNVDGPGETPTPTSPSPTHDVPPGALVITAHIDPSDPWGASITVSIGEEQLKGKSGNSHTVVGDSDGYADAPIPAFNGEFLPVLEGTPVVVEGNAESVDGIISNPADNRRLAKIADLDLDSGVLTYVPPGNHVLTINASWVGDGYSAQRTLYVPLRFMATIVPDLIGLGDQAAFGTLNDHGLLPASAKYREVPGVDMWHVASQDPPAGAAVQRDTVVEVVIATDITALPEGAVDALDCPASEHEAFGGPNIRILPGGSAYITGNLDGIERGDEVVQVTFGDREWDGNWHVIRDGQVIAVVDFDSLDGVACQGSGVAGA